MTGPDVEAILAQLVAFETVSDRSNRPLCDFVVGFLDRYHVATRRLPDATGEKQALFATIGDPTKPGIVLSAHTDVVPVDGQNWSTPPFRATRDDDRIFGRGTSDMKGFVACVLASVPLFIANCRETPVHIALSYDEEIGCRGAGDLVDTVSTLPTPALCIVGEPTSLRVGRAHKGKIARTIEVFGRSGHSAMPHKAASALDSIVSIASFLRQHARALEDRRPFTGFDPPWSTLHIGSIRSGDALNFVPDHAQLAFELRYVDKADVDAVLRALDAFVEAEQQRLREKAPDARIAMKDIVSYPALDTRADDPILGVVARWAGVRVEADSLSFGTEAGLYAATGAPTVVCGPGDMDRAHKADEWIGCAELAGGCTMLERLAMACRTPPCDWIA